MKEERSGLLLSFSLSRSTPGALDTLRHQKVTAVFLYAGHRACSLIHSSRYSLLWTCIAHTDTQQYNNQLSCRPTAAVMPFKSTRSAERAVAANTRSHEQEHDPAAVPKRRRLRSQVREPSPLSDQPAPRLEDTTILCLISIHRQRRI